MVTHKSVLSDEAIEHGEAAWSKGTSILFLILATVMVAFTSEWLVGTLEEVTHRFGLSELFVGHSSLPLSEMQRNIAQPS